MATERHCGNVVVVSCGAVNSAALLLRSTSDRHPDGLGNSSGTVGRHYMCHINSAMLAISKEPNPTRFQTTLGINDYDWGLGGFRLPPRPHSNAGKDGRADVTGRGAVVRTWLRSRVHRATRDPLLAYD